MGDIRQPEVFEEVGSSLFVPARLVASRDLSAGMPFRADATCVSVGPVTMARFAITPALVLRSAGMITSADRELVKVVLLRGGSLIASQDGRQNRIRPGDLVAYDTRRPSKFVLRDNCDIVMMGFPRPMLGPGGDLISHRTAVSVPGDHGIRSVVATFFGGLADTVLAGDCDDVRGPDAVRLLDTVVSLLITAFTGMPAERVELPSTLADQILSYALANLHDPGLSVGSAARRFGISARYLHTLMRDRDIQFGAWVRRERMKRIRRDLLDSRLANVTAAAIAARWGIQDPDHLSRSLRAEFGCSAAELRASAAQPS